MVCPWTKKHDVYNYELMQVFLLWDSKIKYILSPYTSGPVYNDDGDIIITEEEFLQIQKLKDLKITYRNDFDELKNLKTQVQYCQKLVDQCRQRLLNGEWVIAGSLPPLPPSTCLDAHGFSCNWRHSVKQDTCNTPLFWV